jgi:hypothetical protein
MGFEEVSQTERDAELDASLHSLGVRYFLANGDKSNEDDTLSARAERVARQRQVRLSRREN